jgi:threonine aldolase
MSQDCASNRLQSLRAARGTLLSRNFKSVEMPEAIVAELERQGFGVYRWPLSAAPAGVAIRLVTSYATPRAHVDEFLAAVQGSARG